MSAFEGLGLRRLLRSSALVNGLAARSCTMRLASCGRDAGRFRDLGGGAEVRRRRRGLHAEHGQSECREDFLVVERSGRSLVAPEPVRKNQLSNSPPSSRLPDGFLPPVIGAGRV